MTLNGGMFSIIGADGAATKGSAGSLIAASGASTLQISSGAGGSAALTFASLGTRGAGATVDFVGSDLGGAQRLLFNSGLSDGEFLGGRATVNGTDFAKYDAADGIVAFTPTDYSVNDLQEPTGAVHVKLDPWACRAHDFRATLDSCPECATLVQTSAQQRIVVDDVTICFLQ